MNPADLAVIAVTEFPLMAVALAVVVTNHRERMAVADRVRLVNPVKAPVPPVAETAATVEDLSKRRPA